MGKRDPFFPDFWKSNIPTPQLGILYGSRDILSTMFDNAKIKKIKLFFMEKNEKLPEGINNRQWVGKFVHYEEGNGKSLVAEIISFDPEMDRYLVRPMHGQVAEENFFIKGDKLRALLIEEK